MVASLYTLAVSILHPVANYVLFTVWPSQKQYGPEA